MKRFYFRPFALLLAVIFLFSSVAIQAQNRVPGICNISGTVYDKHESSPIKADTQLPFEEKEEKSGADNSESTFLLIHTQGHFNSLYSTTSEDPAKTELSSAVGHVALYLAVRNLRL